jgi:hypothetical protein
MWSNINGILGIGFFFIFKININLCSFAYFKSHQNLLPNLVVVQQEVAWGEQFKSFLEAFCFCHPTQLFHVVTSK